MVLLVTGIGLGGGVTGHFSTHGSALLEQPPNCPGPVSSGSSKERPRP